LRRPSAAFLKRLPPNPSFSAYLGCCLLDVRVSIGPRGVRRERIRVALDYGSTTTMPLSRARDIARWAHFNRNSALCNQQIAWNLLSVVRKAEARMRDDPAIQNALATAKARIKQRKARVAVRRARRAIAAAMRLLVDDAAKGEAIAMVGDLGEQFDWALVEAVHGN
jgi:hypothetical protein